MKKSGISFLLSLIVLFLPVSALAEEKSAEIPKILIADQTVQSDGPQTAPLPSDPAQPLTPSAQPASPAVSPQPTYQSAPAAPHSAQTGQEGKPQSVSGASSNEVVSKAVEKNLGYFSRIKGKVSLWLSRSGKYLDLMKEIFRRKNVPEDIAFLSFVESGFNPYAYSIANAVGPWQFIASTAKRYGLVINWWKDERRDPIKSTEAAADYLRDLYEMFGSWNLAMAAYNAGEGRILRALEKSNTDNYWALLGTKHIKEETKDYVPRFIAASLIASNPKDFGFGDIEYNQPLSYDEVDLDSPIDLAVAADCAGTELDIIKKLNPELRRWCTPPDVSHYKLRIPQGTKDLFVKKLTTIPEEDRFTIERYTVRKGDTLKKISKRTGVPESVILALNSMEKIMPLKGESRIYLPPKGLPGLDADDRGPIRKVSYKKVSYKKKTSNRKVSFKTKSKTKKKILASKKRSRKTRRV